MSEEAGLHVEAVDGRWALVGARAAGFGLVDEFLGYLADRRYSPATVRAYAFDLLALCRWRVDEGVELDEVSTDVLLRFLAACRTTVLAGQAVNVFAISDGRNVGYAPATVNRRLAAISGLFAFRAMRDPDAASPVPRGKPARTASKAERAGLLGMWPRPSRGHGCGCVSRGGCRAG